MVSLKPSKSLKKKNRVTLPSVAHYFALRLTSLSTSNQVMLIDPNTSATARSFRCRTENWKSILR